MRILAIVLLSIALLAGCDRNEANHESTVTLEGKTYRIIGTSSIEARAQKTMKVIKDDNGAVKKVEEVNKSLTLKGHRIQVNDDGSFTVDGSKERVVSKSSTPTIRIAGEKVVIE